MSSWVLKICITEPLTSHEFSYPFDPSRQKPLSRTYIKVLLPEHLKEKLNVVYILVKYTTHFGVGNMMTTAQAIVKGEKNNYSDEMDLYPFSPNWTS